MSTITIFLVGILVYILFAPMTFRVEYPLFEVLLPLSMLVHSIIQKWGNEPTLLEIILIPMWILIVYQGYQRYKTFKAINDELNK